MSQFEKLQRTELIMNYYEFQNDGIIYQVALKLRNSSRFSLEF